MYSRARVQDTGDELVRADRQTVTLISATLWWVRHDQCCRRLGAGVPSVSTRQATSTCSLGCSRRGGVRVLLRTARLSE